LFWPGPKPESFTGGIRAVLISVAITGATMHEKQEIIACYGQAAKSQ
jgi:hypothetical protein